MSMWSGSTTYRAVPPSSTIQRFRVIPPGAPTSHSGFGCTLKGEDVSSTFTLELNENSDFVSNPEIDVRAFITPNTVAITVPWNPTREIAGVNFYTFCMEKGFTFEPEMTGSDQTGLIEMTSNDFGQATVALTPREEPSTTTIARPSTTKGLPDSAVSEESINTAGNSSPLPAAAIGLGVGAALLGWWVFSRRDTRCRELRRTLKTARRASRKTAGAAKQAVSACANAEAKLESLEQQRKDICTAWPPVCWKTKDGSSMDDAKGNRVTSRDVHMRKTALGDSWDDYKEGKLTALEVERLWRELDTPEFREEMRVREEAFETQLVEIEECIAVASDTFDEMFDQAADAQAKAKEKRDAAKAARDAYEGCVDLAKGQPTDD